MAKNASKAQDPAAAAMSAAAKQVPSAMPVPTFVPPAQPGQTGTDDAAKQEEAHKKEIERKDKELNALRNNNQVMQVQMAHLKALAQLDKHREQVYKGIEQKEQEHRRRMELEDAQLTQRKERMQAEEIKHKATMDVATANQHAKAVEDQAKMTEQYSQRNAQQYVKMTEDARRNADNYLNSRSKDLDKRQSDLDAQQKKLDAEGSRISPIVMNRLQSAIKATGDLAGVRSKLQATPGIAASSTIEQQNALPKVAAFQMNPYYQFPGQLANEAFREFRMGDKEKTMWEDAQRYLGVQNFLKAKAEAAKAAGNNELYESLKKQWDNYEAKRVQTMQNALGSLGGRVTAEDLIGNDKATMSALGNIDMAKAMTMRRAGDTLRAKERQGATLTPLELIKMKSYDNAADNLLNNASEVAGNREHSFAHRLNAMGEQASHDLYTNKHTTGRISETKNAIGTLLGHPEWGLTSTQSEVLGPKGSRNFLDSTIDGHMGDWAMDQFGKTGDDWSKGNYGQAIRHGLKGTLGGLYAFFANPFVTAFDKAPTFTGAPTPGSVGFAVMDGANALARGENETTAPMSTRGAASRWQQAKSVLNRMKPMGVQGHEAANKILAHADLPKNTKELNADSTGEVTGTAFDIISSILGAKAVKGILTPGAKAAVPTAKALASTGAATAAGAHALPALPGAAAAAQSTVQAAKPLMDTWTGQIADAIGGSLSSLIGHQGQGSSAIQNAADILTKSSAAPLPVNPQSGQPIQPQPYAQTLEEANSGYLDNNVNAYADKMYNNTNTVRYYQPYLQMALGMMGIPIGAQKPQVHRTPIDLGRIAEAPQNISTIQRRNNVMKLTNDGNIYNASITPTQTLTNATQANPIGGADNGR